MSIFVCLPSGASGFAGAFETAAGFAEEEEVGRSSSLSRLDRGGVRVRVDAPSPLRLGDLERRGGRSDLEDGWSAMGQSSLTRYFRMIYLLTNGVSHGCGSRHALAGCILSLSICRVAPFLEICVFRAGVVWLEVRP